MSRKAFTLVELLVVMSIIAVLIALSVFGISTAQRNLRDNQRRDTVKNLSAALVDYYTYNSDYPSAATFTALNAAFTTPVPVEGVTSAAADTDAANTLYCYSIVSDGYIVGALLESNTWFTLGSATTECSQTYALAP